MEDKHRRVGFRILSGSLPGSEISRRAGIVPTAVGEPGEHTGGAIRRETVWVIESPLAPPATVEARVAALLDVLERHRGGLASLSYDCLMCVFIGCDPVARASQPVLLGPELLARVAALPGAGILFEAGEAPHPEVAPAPTDFRKERRVSRAPLLHRPRRARRFPRAEHGAP
jgi:hypothetical protein